MSNTYTIIRIDTGFGREELRYDMTHEKAKSVFCAQYGFSKFNPGLKKNGIRIESYQTFSNFNNNNSSDSSSDSSPRRRNSSGGGSSSSWFSGGGSSEPVSLSEGLSSLGFIAGVIGIIAFWEVIVTLLIVGAIGSSGFLGLGAYLNWKEEQDKIKAEEEAEKNRPAQVSHKYRTEAFN